MTLSFKEELDRSVSSVNYVLRVLLARVERI